MSITKNTRLKFETTSSQLTAKQRKRGRAGADTHATPINKGEKHPHMLPATRKNSNSNARPRRRSAIADEMRLSVVSVASVAFSRQKVGNAADANRKTAQIGASAVCLSDCRLR